MPCPALLAAAGSWANAGTPLLPAPAAMADLQAYIDLLIAWNKKLNLSGATNIEYALTHLIQDSFFLAVFLDRLCHDKGLSDPKIADLGAGAGLPGIPLRIVWQKGDYTLVEAREKRSLFLNTTLARLKLPATSVFSGRAETYLARTNPQPRIIVSRAFMPWADLLEFCAAHAKETREIVFMANDPPPLLRDGWQVFSSLSYGVAGRKRWLWAVVRG